MTFLLTSLNLLFQDSTTVMNCDKNLDLEKQAIKRVKGFIEGGENSSLWLLNQDHLTNLDHTSTPSSITSSLKVLTN
eukprot:c29707_g1_i1 orf=1-228(-)